MSTSVDTPIFTLLDKLRARRARCTLCTCKCRETDAIPTIDPRYITGYIRAQQTKVAPFMRAAADGDSQCERFHSLQSHVTLCYRMLRFVEDHCGALEDVFAASMYDKLADECLGFIMPLHRIVHYIALHNALANEVAMIKSTYDRLCNINEFPKIRIYYRNNDGRVAALTRQVISSRAKQVDLGVRKTMKHDSASAESAAPAAPAAPAPAPAASIAPAPVESADPWGVDFESPTFEAPKGFISEMAYSTPALRLLQARKRRVKKS